MGKPIGSGNAFTFREWHAVILGGVVGALAAYLHRIEFSAVGVSLTALFVVGALGARVYDGSVAGKTITKEPWYALGGLAIAGAAVLLVI